MDVHPPLAKLLLTLAGWVAGYDGNFDFKEIGKDYLAPGVPYVAMRVMLSTFGMLMVPLGWYTAVELGMSPFACHLVAIMVLCGEHIFSSAIAAQLTLELQILSIYTG